MKKGFYESYKQEKGQQERPIIVRNASFVSAFVELFGALITAVLYFCTAVLASVGLTTLLNKALRDLFVEMVLQLFK